MPNPCLCAMRPRWRWSAPTPRAFRPPGDPIADTLALLTGGAIVAVKGLGGFHLMCDATDAAAVARLRQRKAREEKPFAVLVASVASARLTSMSPPPTRPCWPVPNARSCCCPRARSAFALDGVAPGLDTLGVMLPSTPLQFLLFHETAVGPPAPVAARPQPLVLVATSANPNGEPLVRDDDEALHRCRACRRVAAPRPAIVARCETASCAAPWCPRRRRCHGGHFIRRARGYTPRAIHLPGWRATRPACWRAARG